MGMLITCLGISGSGKTVFLGTLLDSLFTPANARNSFYLNDRGAKGGAAMRDNIAQSDISISANLHRIGKGDYRGFPPGTKATRLREFSLMQGKESVLDIGWVDYKGGLVSGEHAEPNEQDELFGLMDRSTALVVYLDGYRIATAASVNQARRRVGADAISRILSHLESSKEGKPTNILVVLTQCDAIEDQKWIGSGDYGPLRTRTKEVLGGLIEMINRNPHWHCGVVPVTAVGIGRSRRRIIQEASFNSAAVVEDEIIDEPEPLNVVEAFFWLVGCEVAALRFQEKAAIATAEKDRRNELVRVEVGRKSSMDRVHQEELKRLNSLGFFKRIIETTIREDSRQSNLGSNLQKASSAWTESQKHIASEIENRLLGSSTRLTRYESALQPLFNASSNAVSRI
jgi:hypothetical protein